MKIYRAEICGSQDSCTEFWECLPITDFHTTREGVEKEIAHLKDLKGCDLEKALEKMHVFAYFGDNKPTIEEYDIVEDSCGL